MTRVIGLK